MLGVIKDMVVSLAQLPMKNVIMDVVVADITPKFGMLLSRSWAKKVGGTLQMDLTYATIPIFGGENRRLYRELQFAYIVTDDRNPTNHPLYVVEKDLGSFMLHFSDDNTAGMLQVEKEKPIKCTMEQKDELWKMYFDGSSSKEGAGVGVVMISPGGELVSLMYKLEFVTTNNIVEYEALLLGLRATKDMGIQQISVYGDSELVVQQVRNNYQVKQYLLKVYRNGV